MVKNHRLLIQLICEIIFISVGTEDPLPLREWYECNSLKIVNRFLKVNDMYFVECIIEHTNIEYILTRNKKFFCPNTLDIVGSYTIIFWK